VLLRKPVLSWTARPSGVCEGDKSRNWEFEAHWAQELSQSRVPQQDAPSLLSDLTIPPTHLLYVLTLASSMKLNPKDLMKSVATRLDRHSGTGRRGEAKKQGGGGRGTWGTWQDELRAYADDSHEFFDEGDEDFDLVAYPSTPKEEEGVVAPPPSTVDVPTVKPEQLMMVLTEAYLKSHAYDPAPRRQMPSKSGPCRQALRNPHVRRTGALRQPRPTAQGCH